ncbi:hypothetical protein B0H11DRAFT_1962034, partial [Mycena galericulata]
KYVITFLHHALLLTSLRLFPIDRWSKVYNGLLLPCLAADLPSTFPHQSPVCDHLFSLCLAPDLPSTLSRPYWVTSRTSNLLCQMTKPLSRRHPRDSQILPNPSKVCLYR